MSKHGCASNVERHEPPDLQDGCSSTCLTKPYKCDKCSSFRKQLAWRCVDCNGLRDNSVQTWNNCQCSKHVCNESVLGMPLCKKCSDRCLPRN
ncbi:hypothetical protein GGS24DRAFT_267228 [Hypoxylon argillaceum]|nr:hypothetical protein GGS24DRAFT_267228 [Hypoxylon argillaceum]